MMDYQQRSWPVVGAWSESAERTVIAILLLLLLALVIRNALDILNASHFHEELRILYHFDPTRTNSKDYIGQFLGRFHQPLLYVYATKAALAAGIDLIAFHKLLIGLCSALLLVGAALSGLRAGGVMAAVAVAVLIAAQPVYHYQISSATPHAFAFPLLAWALCCLLYERPYWLASLTVLSGLLYPPISPVLGLILASYLLISRKALSGQNPDRVFDILVIVATAAITFTLFWHQVSPIDGYGATLAPGEKVDIYPENGEDGRHFHGVFHPLNYVVAVLVVQFNESLPVLAILFLPICIVAIAGLGLYYARHQAALMRLFLSFILPSLLFFALITLLRPYVAYRFLLYPLFTVLPLLFVYGLLTLCYDHRSTLRHPSAVVAAVLLLSVIALHSSEEHRNLAPLRLDRSSHELMGYLRTLPTDTLVAAWPLGPQISLIPYVAGRPLLVDYKAHYPIYEGHIVNMRARMFDLIDAYLARDIQPLVALRCRWQVDILIVDRTHFSGARAGLEYFAPFDERIDSILETADLSKLILRELPVGAILFQAGKFTVVDLAELSNDVACPADW